MQCWWRLIYTVDSFFCFYVRDTKQATTQHVLHALINQCSQEPKYFVLDRQPSFTSFETQRWPTSQNIHFKYATPHRHGELNGLAERAIESPRLLSRSSLLDANF